MRVTPYTEDIQERRNPIDKGKNKRKKGGKKPSGLPGGASFG